jgi:hypothetical protein
MTLDDLTATLDTLGVRLSARLVVDAPYGVLTPEIKSALSAHKPALLARLAAGGDEADVQSRPSWDELSRWRWGPAIDAPTPGIIIDRPDRVRMLDAFRAAHGAPDPYAVEERTAIRNEVLHST